MKNSRLFEILYLLEEKRAVTAGELAQRLEVSERTIYRDPLRHVRSLYP